jgi:hypothetical protein
MFGPEIHLDIQAESRVESRTWKSHIIYPRFSIFTLKNEIIKLFNFEINNYLKLALLSIHYFSFMTEYIF